MTNNVIEILLKMLGTDAAAKDLQGFGKKMAGIGKSMQKVGLGMTAGITAPLALMAKQSVEAASTLEEAMGAIRSVFPENAETVSAWADSLASDFGITKAAGLDAIAGYGLIMQNMGLTGETALEMGTDFVELAADMAAFRDVPIEQALEAIRSGLTGSTMPLKQFGVMLDVASVEAKALEMGLIAEGEEMTKAAKATAMHALLLQETAIMQGTVARESGSLAGQLKIAGAEFENMKAEIGNALIPVIMQLLPYVRQAIQWFQDLSPEVKKGIIVFAAIAAAIGPFLMVLGTLMTIIPAVITIITAIATPIGLIIVAILAVVATLAFFYLAWKNNWFGIRDIVTNAIDWIYERTLKPFVELATDLWEQFGDRILKAITDTWEFIKGVWETYTGWVSEYIAGWIALLSGDFKGAGEIWGNLFKDMFGGLLEIITNVFTSITDFVTEWRDKFVAGAQKMWDTWGGDITAIFSNTWKIITTIFRTVVGVILGVISAFFSLLTGDTKQAQETLKDVFNAAWKNILKIFEHYLPAIGKAVFTIQKRIYDTVKEWMGKTWESIKDAWENIKTSVSDTSKEIWENIKDWADDVWTSIKDFGENIVESIKDAWADMLNAIKEAGPKLLKAAKDLWEDIKKSISDINWNDLGRSIIEGIAQGLKNFASLLSQAATDAARNAYDAAMGWLRGGSPSKKFAEIGESMIQGVALGIEKMQALPAEISVTAVEMVEKVWQKFTKWIEEYIDGWIALLSGDFKEAGKTWNKLFKDMWTKIKKVIVLISGVIWKNIKDWVKDIWDTIIQFRADIVQEIKEAWEDLLTTINEGGAKIWADIKMWAANVWNTFKKFRDDIVQEIRAAWADLLSAIQAGGAKIWSDIKTWAANVWDTFKKFRTDIVKEITDAWAAMLTAVKEGGTKMWDEVKAWATNVWDTIKEFCKNIVQSIKDAWADMLAEIKSGGEKIISEARNIWDKLKRTVSDVDWIGVGRDIIDGIVAGIVRYAYQIYYALRQAVLDAIAGVQGLLGIQSPSKVFAKMGAEMMKGMALGVQSMQGLPAAASVGAAATAANSVINNYYLTARYEYQSPTSLMDDVRLLELMRGA